MDESAVIDATEEPEAQTPFTGPDKLLRLFERPAFQSLPYERQKVALSTALSDTYGYFSSKPDFSDESSVKFGTLATRAYQKLDDQHTLLEKTKEKAAGVYELGKGLLKDAGTAAYASLDAFGGGITGETAEGKPIATTGLGEGLQLGSAELIDRLTHLHDAFNSSSDNELRDSLREVKRQIDAGEAPVSDYGKFRGWLDQKSTEILKPQNDWTQYRLGGYGVSEADAFRTASNNQLNTPKNAGLLAAYIRTRNPDIWTQIEKNFISSPLEAQFGDEAKAITDSPSGKIMDDTFGKGAAEHLLSASDPLVLATFLIPGLRAAKIARAGAAAEGGLGARAAQAAIGVAKGLPEQAAIGAAFTIGHDPEATGTEIAKGVTDMMAAGAAFHSVGAVVGEVGRGVQKFANIDGKRTKVTDSEIAALGLDPKTIEVETPTPEAAAVARAPEGEVRDTVAAVVEGANPESISERRATIETPESISERRATIEEPTSIAERRAAAEAAAEKPESIAERRAAADAAAEKPASISERRATIETPASISERRAAIEEPGPFDAAPPFGVPLGAPVPPPSTSSSETPTPAPEGSVPGGGRDAGTSADREATGSTAPPVSTPTTVKSGTEPVKTTTESVPISTSPVDGTSNKERIVNIEREVRGEEPIPKEEAIKNTATIARGVQLLSDNPLLPKQITTRLREAAPQDRTISLDDSAVLVAYRVDLHRERNAITEQAAAGDPVAVARWKELEKEIDTLDQAAQDARSVWGRFGQFWQRMVRQDYSLEALERKARVAKGDSLSPEESIKIEKIAKEHADFTKVVEEKRKVIEEIQAARHQNAELQKLLAEAQAGKPTAPAAKQKITPKIITFLDEQAAAARERIAQRRKEGRLSMAFVPFDAAKYVDEAIIGATHIAKGIIKFPEWSAKMLAELGDYIKPQLEGLFDESKRYLKNTARDIPAERASTVAKLKERVTEGTDNPDIHRYSRSLAEQFIEEGITEVEPLNKAVHSVLKDIIPGITEHEAGNAWSGYGNFRRLNMDPVKVRLRELSTERQKLSTIERYESGQAGLKSGVERQPPTAKARELDKRARKLAKDLGIENVDPATQLKSSLDATKSRLQNEIADLDHAIATGRRMTRDKSGVEYDAEAQSLKEQRDARKGAYDLIFPKEPISPEEQLRRATKLAEKNLEQWGKKLADAKDGVFEAPKKPTGPINQNLQYLRDQAKAAAVEYAELKDAANPGKSPIERAILAKKAAILRRIADLQKRQAANDFGPRPKPEKPVATTAAEKKAETELAEAAANKEIAEREFNQLKHEFTQANRTTGKRIKDAIQQTRGATLNVASSFDFSAPRQALVAIMANTMRLRGPKMTALATGRMFKAWASERGAQIIEQRIKNRPNALSGADKAAGIEYSDLETNKFNKFEENAHSILDEWAKLPFKTGNRTKSVATAPGKAVAKGIRMSNRAFVSFLNSTRASLFDELLKVNYKDRAPTLNELKVLGNYVNIATGRGKMGPNTSRFLSEGLWAPKLLASRFQLATGQPLWGAAPFKDSGRARRIVAQEYARVIASGVLLATVASMFNQKKGNTPSTSSDWGKIVRGDTRIDPWGGFQQLVVLTSRVAQAKTTSARGETYDAGAGRNATVPGPFRMMMNFVRSKLRPDVGTVVDLIDRENMVGQKTTPKMVAENLLIPLPGRDLVEILKAHGWPEGLAIEAVGQFGAGVSHYTKESGRPSK